MKYLILLVVTLAGCTNPPWVPDKEDLIYELTMAGFEVNHHQRKENLRSVECEGTRSLYTNQVEYVCKAVKEVCVCGDCDSELVLFACTEYYCRDLDLRELKVL